MDSFLSLVIGLVLGILIYYLDLKRGIKWFRSWYDLTHKEPSKEPLRRGFVHRQPFSGKFSVALVLSVLIAFALFSTGSLNIFIILLSCGIIMAAMVVGFYLGPVIFSKIVPRIDDLKGMLERIDELEEDLTGTSEKEESPKPLKKEMPEKKEELKPEKEDKKNWRGGIRDFLDK